MPYARRITFGTQVIPTQSIEMEETSVRHAEFMASPGTTIGGKGTATINATQWGDGWVSFSHHGAYWEDQSDVWELQGEAWSGKLSISDGATDLTDDSNDLAFLYIKNLGSTAVVISLDGGDDGGTWPLKLSEGASTMFRGYSSNLKINEVYVKSGGTSTIEYLIAK